MFNFFKSSNNIISPVSGKVIDLSQVPDQVFAQKMAGEGVAIDSTSDTFVAPCDGTIALIFKTNHAYALTLKNGIQILVHIGIDTVELNGEGFERLAEENTEVKAGDPIIKINRDVILNAGKSLITPVLITNPELTKEINCSSGQTVECGKDSLYSYKLK